MNGVIIPLIALYNFDPTIFDGLKMPTAADLDPNLEYIDDFPTLSNADLRDELLMQIGELSPVYSKPEVLKHSISVWARVHKLEWTKLWQSAIYKYNPIWNKDGTIRETYNYGAISQSGTENGNGNATTEDTDKVAGFNSDTTHTREERNGTATQTTKSNTTNRQEEHTDTVERIEQGNIGVTESSAMVRHEVELREDFNIYDIIAKDFKRHYCIMVY